MSPNHNCKTNKYNTQTAFNELMHNSDNWTEPSISIIIPLYNNELLIGQAIKSVITQQYRNIELVIVDGGSTDKSLAVIKTYEDKIDYLISEPDKGIYDAMNKGIDQAKGEWIYFLGSDDILVPDVISKVIPYLSADIALVYGDVYLENGWRYPSFFSARTVIQNTVHHQGAFYNRELFKNFRYDTHLKILSDYELNLYIYKNDLPTHRMPLVIANCMGGGASSQIDLSIKETNMIRARFVTNKFINWNYSVILRIYYAQKKIRAYVSRMCPKNLIRLSM